jgi:hypothetical protein
MGRPRICTRARASTLRANVLAAPALVFTWFTRAMFMATTFLLFTSMFFRWPIVEINALIERAETATGGNRPAPPRIPEVAPKSPVTTPMIPEPAPKIPTPVQTTVAYKICSGEYERACKTHDVYLYCSPDLDAWAKARCSSYTIQRIDTYGGNKCGYSLDTVLCTTVK